jgi:hypothetical protein
MSDSSNSRSHSEAILSRVPVLAGTSRNQRPPSNSPGETHEDGIEGAAHERLTRCIAAQDRRNDSRALHRLKTLPSGR